MLWKSKGLLDKIIEPPSFSDNSFNPRLDYFNNPKFWVEFNGSCLKNDSAGFKHKRIKLYITYEINSWSYVDNGFTLRNSLFEGIKLTKNADLDQVFLFWIWYFIQYTWNFSLPNDGFGKNVVIFGAAMNSSMHVDNKKKIS